MSDLILNENAEVKEQKQGFKNYDPATSKVLNFLMDKKLLEMTEFIKRIYTNRVIIGNYEAIRKLYSHDDMRSKSGMREIYRPPHEYVHRFIDAEMTKKYGTEWNKDVQLFREICRKEDLIAPWLVVPRNKI